jgi:zinc/manganese transport system permease protein
MVCVFGGALALAGLLYPFLRGDAALASRRAVVALRWCVAAILAGSALLLMLAPRFDQPLPDAVEHAFPQLRAAYLSAAEAAAYADASLYAERYRLEAERLNDIETRSRSQGDALADEMVRRISSFLKSYGEMRRGEEFVMREVRSRARERVRWVAGPAMLLLAFLVAPGGLTMLRRRRTL